MLLFHLPPNLTAAAARDAVPLRVELDLAEAPDPRTLPILALLQRWCGTATPPKFIQLNRRQLAGLVAAAADLPVFAEGGTVGPWRHPELLTAAEPPAVTPAAPDPVRRPARPDVSPAVIDGSEHYLAITLPSRE
ncbi:MAG: ATP-dependent helicase, partial [Opitutales bacterium]